MIQPPLGLLTHLVALRSALDEQWAARATEPVVHLHSPTPVTLELLPYAVSEMWHAFTSFIGATHRIAAKLDEEIPILPECLVLADADRDELAYAIDAFMHAGQRAQNAVLPYLASALRQSLPASLSDIFTTHGHTDLRTYPVLDIFAPMLESYWQADGQRLRAYRVVMEHRTLVAREALLARSDAGTVVLHLLLPSNPEAGSSTALIYGHPPVHAFLYMEHAFIALVRFAESMTRPLLPIPLSPKAHIMVANRMAPIRTRNVFHPIPSIEDMSARVKQLAQA